MANWKRTVFIEAEVWRCNWTTEGNKEGNTVGRLKETDHAAITKTKEKDFFDDSIQILEEKTKVYDVEANEKSSDYTQDMLELHPNRWDSQFETPKPGRNSRSKNKFKNNKTDICSSPKDGRHGNISFDRKSLQILEEEIQNESHGVNIQSALHYSGPYGKFIDEEKEQF